MTLSACVDFPALGPSRKSIESPSFEKEKLIHVVPLTNGVAQKVKSIQNSLKFSENLTPLKSPKSTIGPGDSVIVTIWEAPPAILFKSSSSNSITGNTSNTGTIQTVLPTQIVSKDGKIHIPFLGSISLMNLSISEAEALIQEKLKNRANLPQVMVQVSNMISSTITLVGEVNNAGRISLTPKGERILDAIAIGGGLKQSVNKTTIQITRDGKIQSLPLETIIANPKLNISLQPDDVITVYFQPLSFVAMGEVKTPGEITFESQGITLSQALGRMGGLASSGTSDPKGIFIFRYEDPLSLDLTSIKQIGMTPEGKIPTIYQLDLKDPSSLFIAQNFPMKNHDVIYVASAPLVQLMQFLGVITSVLAPGTYLSTQLK